MGPRNWRLAWQYALPKRALSALVGRATRVRGGRLTRAAIALFVRVFRVDLRDAALGPEHEYPTFNEFFTRALREGARPLADDPAAAVSPADGTVSQCGPLGAGRVLQAKGKAYSVTDLFGGDADLAAAFEHGEFCTIYLAPYDYHRVHMPLRGRAYALRYVPGTLFSVNASTALARERLFCRNERVAVVFDGERGRFALVMVGALNVGSIELTVPRATAFANRPLPTFAAGSTHLLDGSVLERGAEFGRFNMGSTVILLASPGVLQLEPTVRPAAVVRMGQLLGRPAAASAPAESGREGDP